MDTALRLVTGLMWPRGALVPAALLAVGVVILLVELCLIFAPAIVLAPLFIPVTVALWVHVACVVVYILAQELPFRKKNE